MECHFLSLTFLSLIDLRSNKTIRSIFKEIVSYAQCWRNIISSTIYNFEAKFVSPLRYSWGGSHSPLTLMHTRALNIHLWGVTYLAKKITRHCIFQYKCKCLFSIHLISIYIFWDNHLKFSYLLILPKKIGKKIAIQITR